MAVSTLVRHRFLSRSLHTLHETHNDHRGDGVTTPPLHTPCLFLIFGVALLPRRCRRAHRGEGIKGPARGTRGRLVTRLSHRAPTVHPYYSRPIEPTVCRASYSVSVCYSAPCRRREYVASLVKGNDWHRKNGGKHVSAAPVSFEKSSHPSRDTQRSSWGRCNHTATSHSLSFSDLRRGTSASPLPSRTSRRRSQALKGHARGTRGRHTMRLSHRASHARFSLVLVQE